MPTVLVYDKVIEYEKIYRRIKNPRLEFRLKQLQVILPLRYKDENILIQRHRKWLYKKATLLDELNQTKEKLPLNYTVDGAEFEQKIQDIIHSYAEELRLRVRKILFRKMKARWGSCDCRGSITVNSYLRFLPELCIRYIAYHEVVHLKYRMHGKRFKRLVKEKFSEYKSIEKLLFAYGFMLREFLLDKRG